jgi:hypothetical protein
MDDMKLSTLQKVRFIYLLGNRFQGSPKLKITCRKYDNFEENMAMCIDQLKQVYWEALRAPAHDEQYHRSASRRWNAKVKLGRTKEERIARKEELKQEETEYIAKREEEIIEEQRKIDKEQERVDENRRNIMLLRQKLGFDDPEGEIVVDEIVEDS